MSGFLGSLEFDGPIMISVKPFLAKKPDWTRPQNTRGI